MEKSRFNKKLKSYTAFAGSIALFGSQSDAQIVYTDIIPDSTTIVGGNFYDLDLNNDGISDFKIQLKISGGTSFTSQQVSVSPVTSNGVAGDTVGMYVYPFALNAGDTVKLGLQFNLTSNQSMGSYFGPGASYGNWIGATDKYLGLSFYIGPDLYYGWARLDIDSVADKFTIKDYAYNATIGAPIIAGQTGVGIHENSLDNNVLIYSYDKNVKISFLNTLDATNADVKITNTLGQEIFRSTAVNKEMDINLSDKRAGIYFVTVTEKNGVFTKKINLR